MSAREILPLRGASVRASKRRSIFSTAFPNMGRKGQLPGTREMVVPGLPYIIVYRIESGDEEALAILGIYHGAQRRPGHR